MSRDVSANEGGPPELRIEHTTGQRKVWVQVNNHNRPPLKRTHLSIPKVGLKIGKHDDRENKEPLNRSFLFTFFARGREPVHITSMNKTLFSFAATIDERSSAALHVTSFSHRTCFFAFKASHAKRRGSHRCICRRPLGGVSTAHRQMKCTDFIGILPRRYHVPLSPLRQIHQRTFDATKSHSHACGQCQSRHSGSRLEGLYIRARIF